MTLMLRLLLSLVLAVTSVTYASARVQQAGLVDVVICAQGMERILTLDPQGHPVERGHHCPDCLAALPLPPLPTLPTAPPPVWQAADQPLPLLSTPSHGVAGLPPARGPPVLA
jgi:hypothetical protein